MTLGSNKKDDAWYQRVAASISEAPPEVRGLMGRLVASALVVLGCLFFLADGGWRVELGYTCAAFGMVCLVELVLWVPWIKQPKIPMLIRPMGMESQEWLEEQQRREEEQSIVDYEASLKRSKRERKINLIRVPVEMALLIGLAIYLGFLTLGSTNPFFPAKGRMDKYLQEQTRTQAKLEQVQEELSKSKADQAQEREQFSKNRDELTKSFDKITKERDDLAQKIEAIRQNGGDGSPPGSPGNGGRGTATDTGDGGIHLSWSVLLLAIVALVVLGLVAKKHKEALPVAGAAGLALEALKHGGELSKMTEAMYWHLLNYFLFVSVALLVVFVVVAVLDIWKRHIGRARATVEHEVPSESRKPTSFWEAVWLRMKGGDKGERKESTESYLSSLGFSVLVLLWAAVMVGYKAGGIETTPKPPKPASTELSSKPLPMLGPFIDGKDSLVGGDETLEQWKKAIAGQEMRHGDIVILQGATDCKPFRPKGRGNLRLADDRSKKAEEWLQPEMAKLGVSLSQVSVQQPERCKESADLRNVYPFLIQGNQP